MSTVNPRRAGRDGSVGNVPRADGRWPYRWYDAWGREHYGYAATREQAVKDHRGKLAERDRGIPVVSKRYTLGAWLDTWVEALPDGEGGLRPTTRERYRLAVKRWRADPIAGVKLHTLRPETVSLALRRLERSGLAVSTVRFMLAILRMALASALVSEHVSRNVAAAPYVHTPAGGREGAGAPPSPDDFARMRRGMAGDELELLWVLCSDMGLRVGEALALRWGDVSPAGVLHVAGTLLPGGHRGKPKTKGSDRRLPMDSAVIAAIARHERRAGYGPSLRPLAATPIFLRADGTRHVDHRYALRAWVALCKRVGAKPCRIHDLRHSFATRYLERYPNGIRVVSRYLGHSSTRVTEAIYAHDELLEAPGIAEPLDTSFDTGTGAHLSTT